MRHRASLQLKASRVDSKFEKLQRDRSQKPGVSSQTLSGASESCCVPACLAHVASFCHYSLLVVVIVSGGMVAGGRCCCGVGAGGCEAG
jgi:hypothetical protein